MQLSVDVLRADQATTERAEVLVPFRLTDRQARFLATVMVHSGVFVGRQTPRSPGSHTGKKSTTSYKSLSPGSSLHRLSSDRTDGRRSSMSTTSRFTPLSVSRTTGTGGESQSTGQSSA